jgi:hypothetical protein
LHVLHLLCSTILHSLLSHTLQSHPHDFRLLPLALSHLSAAPSFLHSPPFFFPCFFFFLLPVICRRDRGQVYDGANDLLLRVCTPRCPSKQGPFPPTPNMS